MATNTMKSIEGADFVRIDEASRLTGLSQSRLYKLSAPAVAEIPVYKVGGSNLYLRSDLAAYMAGKRRYCRRETASLADTHVVTEPAPAL